MLLSADMVQWLIALEILGLFLGLFLAIIWLSNERAWINACKHPHIFKLENKKPKHKLSLAQWITATFTTLFIVPNGNRDDVPIGDESAEEGTPPACDSSISEQLLFKEKNSDVKIVFPDGDIVYAHKTILATATPYFGGPWKENNPDGVWKTQTSKNVIKTVLKYIYTGKIDLVSSFTNVPLDTKDLCQVLSISAEFQMPKLQKVAEAKVIAVLSPNTLKAALFAAQLHNLPDLKTACLSFVRGNWSELSRTPSIVAIALEDPALWKEMSASSQGKANIYSTKAHDERQPTFKTIPRKLEPKTTTSPKANSSAASPATAAPSDAAAPTTAIPRKLEPKTTTSPQANVSAASPATAAPSDAAAPTTAATSDVWSKGAFPFLGPGHFASVAGVCRAFKEDYFAYSVAFSSVSLAEIWDQESKEDNSRLSDRLVCQTIAKYGNLEALKWARGKNFPWNNRTCTADAGSGHLDVLKYAHGNGCMWNSNTCAAAAGGGHLEVLMYLRDKGCHLDESACSAAAEGGHFECLRYAHHNGHWRVQPNTCAAAAKGGNLKCPQFAHRNGCRWSWRTCAEAAKGGHLELLKYARENGCDWNEHAYAWAARNGHLQCLQYLKEKGCPWHRRTCTLASAGGGHLECLKYLHEKGCPWDGSACAAAGGGGHLEVLKHVRDKGCPWDKRTVYLAVKNGHDDIAEWAYQNGCPWTKLLPARDNEEKADNDEDGIIKKLWTRWMN